MVLESTIVCVDNSDFMRNGDFVPTRLGAQQDAVNLVCHSKTRSNPENNVGLLTLTSGEVLVTLTNDVGRILSKLHQIQPSGNPSFSSAIRVAHLALKHRQGRNHKMRIIAFIGSPIEEDEKELVKIAKRLKKEKVNVDLVNFGEQETNTSKLEAFVSTLNGKDGTSSHIVTVSAGPTLADALVSSPVIVGEDGTGVVAGYSPGGLDIGFDPNEDPELALALRVSMEEQRARQDDEARRVQAETAGGATGTQSAATTEEAMLADALSMARPVDSSMSGGIADFSAMSEEEQIAYAMQMSMQPTPVEESPMETDDAPGRESSAGGATSETPGASGKEEDFADVVNDPEFLQNVLESLPGVDPNSDAIRSAVGALTQKEGEKKDGENKDKKEEGK